MGAPSRGGFLGNDLGTKGQGPGASAAPSGGGGTLLEGGFGGRGPPSMQQGWSGGQRPTYVVEVYKALPGTMGPSGYIFKVSIT